MFGKRPDATLCDDVPPYRRMMLYLMRGANESVVNFTQEIDVTETVDFIGRWNATLPHRRITPFHVCVWAVVRTLEARPQLNRFVSGGKTWQRDGAWITYAAKKRMADESSPLVTLKERFEPGWSLAETVDVFYKDLGAGRSDEKSYTDKELAFLLRLPGPLLWLGVKALKGLDVLGLLPRSYVDEDPMFTSVFMANMGSLKMDSVYHHLYEYGNCPIFAVVGKVEDVAKVEAGKAVSRKVMYLRYTYDERIADGMYAQHSMDYLRGIVEDPAAAGAVIPGEGEASVVPLAKPEP